MAYSRNVKVVDENGKRVLTPPEKPVQTGDFITPKGKNVRVVMDPMGFGLFVVEFEEGGQVPSSLSGKFTGREEAEKAIEKWLKQKT